jgi:hypothetical protein
MHPATRQTDYPPFSFEMFRNQVPWYGPYIGDAGYDMVLSSALKTWPASADYNLVAWLFDASGTIVAGKTVLEGRRAGVPVTLSLREHFPGVPPMRGMVAVLLRAVDSAAELPASPETWAFRILTQRGISEIIATDSSTSVNFPERSGRRGVFRLFSGALIADDVWRSVAYILNPSANVDYSTTVNLRAVAFNDRGERLEADAGRVPPFGAAWIDLSELFGAELETLLARTGGRGSYVMTSDDASCFAYHFLYAPETRELAGDHTRPLMAYLPKGYGGGSRTLGRRLARGLMSTAAHAAARLTKRESGSRGGGNTP